ncbi:hypothetical protein REC12_07075 [Desulfosporosinus sp. PR]|uniref:hypothetical protein n=1 Tax=Candidatus Desulfosporosinus nitrosoreducens TaxID=3401928 RepID=UPI0027F1EF2F|nr:hypothetical protein [Desulfosporosinus sp. PR]MDQ7093348.1 hypothetical protein [Desulfosporosinus sp. PR]
MTRLGKGMLVLLLIFLLGGCSNLSWTTAGKIVPPVNNTCPLEGKWKVLQDLHSGEGNQEWVGDTAQFTSEAAMFGDYVWSNPTYKIKKVNSTDYLLTKYLSLPGTLVPANKEVDVITLTTAENFLGEFMKINDSKIIAFVQNNVLLLQKVSEQADHLADVHSSDEDIKNQNRAGASGILLGVKLQQNGEVVYQTLWLAADNKQLHQVLTSNNIFFPRTSGFWELQVHRQLDGAAEDDQLSAHDVTTKIAKLPSRGLEIDQPKAQGFQKKIIDYVGNDYVAIENNTNGINQLQVLPVDKISTQTGIKASDLLEDSGFSAYTKSRALASRALSNEGFTLIDKDNFEENFGLARKNGHWYLQGRINYLSQGTAHCLDYNMNLIPPTKLIYYDTLCLNWKTIIDRVPDAVDAFTSPNRDIALVMTKTKLYVYGISVDQLDSEPLLKLELKDGESPIMAEWATGSYVDNWEKAFLAYGAKVTTGKP